MLMEYGWLMPLRQVGTYDMVYEKYVGLVQYHLIVHKLVFRVVVANVIKP
jgi:hypothetical protein